MDCEQIQRDALALTETERMDLALQLLRSGKPLSDERQAPEPSEVAPELRKIQDAALALPEAERDELCRNLLVSLEPQEGLVSEEEAEASWLPEIRRRVAEIERGEAEMIPYEQVLREIQELLQ